MSFKSFSIWAITLFSVSNIYGATYILGDYYNSNGNGVVVGVSGTGNTPTEVETTGLYDPNGNAGNPSGYNAIAVGNIYGGGVNYRSVTTIDLSGLAPAPAGFEYVLNSLTVVLEVSGGTTDGRPATTIDFYEGDFASGGHIALPSTANASQLFNDPSSSFIEVDLLGLNLDLNSATEFVFTMDAPNAGSGEYYTLGSGQGPNIGFAGTSAIEKAPEIRIDFDLVAIPEPSTGLLALLGCSVFGLTYRRRANS